MSCHRNQPEAFGSTNHVNPYQRLYLCTLLIRVLKSLMKIDADQFHRIYIFYELYSPQTYAVSWVYFVYEYSSILECSFSNCRNDLKGHPLLRSWGVVGPVSTALSSSVWLSTSNRSLISETLNRSVKEKTFPVLDRVTQPSFIFNWVLCSSRKAPAFPENPKQR